MTTRQKHYERESHDLILDITILPIYRICKTFVSNKPYKELLNKILGHFIFDCFVVAFWFYVLYWIGTWKFVGKQFYFFWWLGLFILGIMILCFFIGRFRRKRYTRKSPIHEELIKDLPKHPQSLMSDYGDLTNALSGLGYNSNEVSEAVNYVDKNAETDITLEEQLRLALEYFK